MEGARVKGAYIYEWMGDALCDFIMTDAQSLCAYTHIHLVHVCACSTCVMMPVSHTPLPSLPLTPPQMKADEDRIVEIRNLGIKAKKNKSAVAYDITTTQYNQDTEGVEQKYVDDMIRYRAKVRTHQVGQSVSVHSYSQRPNPPVLPHSHSHYS